ncbi:hypothetical protein [Streptomyces sp. SAI-149]|uniref:hypothetical protein n=1 Tax=unclassified Streptomyces TaxID=2593676 RepID=UPI002474C503|nr:hypothetical protein [Streptomyces sp. SAI-149]MDH6493867.1 hypothetical protein [Streptomyces sp. SAI-149]
MPSPIAGRHLLSALFAVALVAFGYYVRQPAREACALGSEPYGSTFTPDNAHSSSHGQCGEKRTRFLTWLGR